MENNEEVLNSVSQQENVDSTNNYIEAIKEMKQNSVNREDYERLKQENKQLLETLVTGNMTGTPDNNKEEEPVDISELRNKLLNQDSDNLEYISNALKLREELIKRGEADPFLPAGKNIVPTKDDIDCAQRVADVLQECVDYADGDSNIFTTELQRVTVDTAPVKRR